MKKTHTEMFETEEQELLPKSLDETYSPPGLLDIPQKAKERFADSGQTLHWVRIFENNGDLDVKNIRLRESEGFSFVTREEIPEMNEALHSHFGEEVAKHRDLICVGDVALARIPTAKVEARKEYFATLNKERGKAIIRDLKQHSIGDPSRGDVYKAQWNRSKRPADFGE